jgi:hypothetical protein
MFCDGTSAESEAVYHDFVSIGIRSAGVSNSHSQLSSFVSGHNNRYVSSLALVELALTSYQDFADR